VELTRRMVRVDGRSRLDAAHIYVADVPIRADRQGRSSASRTSAGDYNPGDLQSSWHTGRRDGKERETVSYPSN